MQHFNTARYRRVHHVPVYLVGSIRFICVKEVFQFLKDIVSGGNKADVLRLIRKRVYAHPDRINHFIVCFIRRPVFMKLYRRSQTECLRAMVIIPTADELMKRTDDSMHDVMARFEEAIAHSR